MTEFDSIYSRLEKLENRIGEQEKINKKRFAVLRDEMEVLKAKFRWLEDYCSKEIKETDTQIRGIEPLSSAVEL